MDIDEQAKQFDEMLTELEHKREKLLAEAVKQVARWEEEIKPLTDVMAKHGMLFKNPMIAGHTGKGVVIGASKGRPNLLYALSKGFPRLVDTSTDAFVESENMSMRAFLETADLDILRAGFDYVRSLRCIDNNPLAERNKKLAAFVSGGLL